MDPTIMLLSFRLAAVERERRTEDARVARTIVIARRRARTARARATATAWLRGVVPAAPVSEPSCCTA